MKKLILILFQFCCILIIIIGIIYNLIPKTQADEQRTITLPPIKIQVSESTNKGKWQYGVTYFHIVTAKSPTERQSEFSKLFNEWADDGWEYVGPILEAPRINVNGRYYPDEKGVIYVLFRRIKQESNIKDSIKELIEKKGK